MPVRDVVAKNLRLLRAAKGWSQEELAAKCGLHRTYVGSIERAERSIGVDNLEKIASAFGVDIAVLLSQEQQCGE